MADEGSQARRRLRFWASLCARARSPSILKFSRLCPGKQPQPLLVPSPAGAQPEARIRRATEAGGTRPEDRLRRARRRGSGAPMRACGTPGRRRGAPRKRAPRRRRAERGRERLEHRKEGEARADARKCTAWRARRSACDRRRDVPATNGQAERRNLAGRQAQPSPRRGTSRGRRAKTAGGSGRWGGPGTSCNTQEAGRRPPRRQAAKTRQAAGGGLRRAGAGRVGQILRVFFLAIFEDFQYFII